MNSPRIEHGFNTEKTDCALIPFRVRSGFHAWLSFLFIAQTPSAWAAEPGFPRGEGYYYNLLNLIALLVLYFCWVRTSAWIDEDARLLHISPLPWNPLMLGCGVAGMFVV